MTTFGWLAEDEELELGLASGVIFVRHFKPVLGVVIVRCSSRSLGLLHAARDAVAAARSGYLGDAVSMEEVAVRMALHGGL